MWDLPRPGLKPVSPALAGGFLTTAPPGKPFMGTLKKESWMECSLMSFSGCETLRLCYPGWFGPFSLPGLIPDPPPPGALAGMAHGSSPGSCNNLLWVFGTQFPCLYQEGIGSLFFFLCFFVCLFWPRCQACGGSQFPNQGLNPGPRQWKR